MSKFNDADVVVFEAETKVGNGAMRSTLRATPGSQFLAIANSVCKGRNWEVKNCQFLIDDKPIDVGKTLQDNGLQAGKTYKLEIKKLSNEGEDADYDPFKDPRFKVVKKTTTKKVVTTRTGENGEEITEVKEETIDNIKGTEIDDKDQEPSHQKGEQKPLTLDDLEGLKELKDAGLLSEEEYNAKKELILSQM